MSNELIPNRVVSGEELIIVMDQMYRDSEILPLEEWLEIYKGLEYDPADQELILEIATQQMQGKTDIHQ